MRLLSDAIAIIRNHRRAYVACNIGYYGLILVGLAWAQVDRSFSERWGEAVRTSVSSGALKPVGDTYASGAILAAIALTFGLNLFIGSLASITLPSLVLPFSGLAVAGLRAFLWGLLFSPKPELVTLANIPMGIAVALVLVLEGQAYVQAMLAAWIQGRGFVRPSTLAAANRAEGMRRGLAETGRLYVLVILTLAIAAAYEVLVSTLPMPGAG